LATNEWSESARDDQRSLLSYYSSETTTHATNLLALALVILTAVQILQGIKWNGPFPWLNGRPVDLAVALFILFGTATWMLGKMLYWAALSSAVLYVDAITRRRFPDNMGGLHDAACLWVHERSTSRVTRFATTFRSLTWRRLGPWVAVLAGGIVLVVVLLLG
jgi:hypothetical protein